MPAAAPALLGVVKHEESPCGLYLTLMAGEKTLFSSLQKKTQPYLPTFAMKQPPSWGRGCHRLSSSLSRQEKPNPLRGRGGPQVSTSTDSNFKASYHHSPQERVPKAHPSPQQSSAGENVAAPTQGRPKPRRAAAGSDVPSRAHLLQAPSQAVGRQC